MGNHIIWIVALFTIQFSGILCRNQYYEYYYSRYHKGHSTTEVISSNTSGITYEEASKSSVPDYKGTTGTSSTAGDSSSENLMHSSTVDHGTTEHSNMTVLQLGISENHEMTSSDKQDVGLIIGIILFSIGLITYCCFRFFDYSKICNKERTRHGNYSEIRETEEQPQQSLLFNQPQLPNCTDGPAQEFPTQSQSHPVQNDTYNSGTQSLYQNNPTAPQQSDNFPETGAHQPQQPLLFNQHQLPSYTEGPVQEFPTYYQYQPVYVVPYSLVAQLYRSNPTARFQHHNFQEPPPPYEAPSYHIN